MLYFVILHNIITHNKCAGVTRDQYTLRLVSTSSWTSFSHVVKSLAYPEAIELIQAGPRTASFRTLSGRYDCLVSKI